MMKLTQKKFVVAIYSASRTVDMYMVNMTQWTNVDPDGKEVKRGYNKRRGMIYLVLGSGTTTKIEISHVVPPVKLVANK